METKRFDVYGIGNALVDFEYLVEDSFLQQHQLHKSSMTLIDEHAKNNLFRELKKLKKKKGGGSAANTLIAMAQLGAKVCYSCKVANDENGSFYLKDLVDQGVEHHLKVETLPPGTTGNCLVLVTNDAERTMCTYLGITAEYNRDQIHWDYLKKAHYLYVEGYLFCSEQGAQAAFESKNYAQKNNVKIALTCSDAGVVEAFKTRFNQFLEQQIDLIFCNEAEALSLSAQKDIYQAMEFIKKLSKHVVITRSAKGVIVWDGKEIVEVPGKKVTSIDANGAGDMFAGAYIYGLSKGFSTKQAAELACSCAAEVIQVYGPRLEKSVVQNILNSFQK